MKLLRRDWISQARAVRIEAEIARRGIKLNGRGPERCGPCPKCGGTDRFAINTSKQIWNCRGCLRGGDVICLVQNLDGCTFGAAVAALSRRAMIRISYSVTCDSPDGQPWRRADSAALSIIVRHARCTLRCAIACSSPIRHGLLHSSHRRHRNRGVIK
jgi:phage/plasmid primase-like uncharacterized protein